ncbi:helix-turn-helix domain-containing protein [Neobacillus sp. D3-1R]|uniref:helix-turn-helix domain-containing protein n=1 Tax=Neobacillus sp. D3-1R TaxID=3445778 RepID=UPI003F9F29F7
MKDSKSKLILHPVRMKIVQSLLNSKKRNVQQLAERLKDVPPATLYRHINKLLEANIIEVVQENQIRGTVEKIYGLKEVSINSQQDLMNLSKDQHLELFLTFTTQLLGIYENYLNQDDIHIVRDGVSYRLANLYLTDEEFLELAKEMGGLIQKAMLNEPSPERKGRNLATIIIPEKKQ